MKNLDQPIGDYYSGHPLTQARSKSEPSLRTDSPSVNPVSVVQELCECNQALLARIHGLEQALTQCQQQLQASAQEMDAQPVELQLHILPVVREEAQQSLAIAHQVAHQQEHLIGLLAHQLENSLQRIADFERDVALSQQRYREQGHRLIQIEQDNQILHSRLQRQQYYSLQLKAALEKTLRHNQVDPNWLERVWNQITKEGGLASSTSSISSWSEDADPAGAKSIDFEFWLEQLCTDESSPWSASEVLFVDDSDKSDTREEEADTPPSEGQYSLSVFPSQEKTVPDIRQPDQVTSSSRSSPDGSRPVSPVPPGAAPSPSCSFQLSEAGGTHPEKPKSPNVPDLPPFLKPRN